MTHQYDSSVLPVHADTCVVAMYGMTLQPLKVLLLPSLEKKAASTRGWCKQGFGTGLTGGWVCNIQHQLHLDRLGRLGGR